MIKIPNHPHC